MYSNSEVLPTLEFKFSKRYLQDRHASLNNPFYNTNEIKMIETDAFHVLYQPSFFIFPLFYFVM